MNLWCFYLTYVIQSFITKFLFHLREHVMYVLFGILWKYLARAVFGSATPLSSIDRNGKNWIIERKQNQKLLWPSNTFVFETFLCKNRVQCFHECCTRDIAVLICFRLWMSVFMKLVYDPFSNVTTVKVF